MDLRTLWYRVNQMRTGEGVKLILFRTSSMDSPHTQRSYIRCEPILLTDDVRKKTIDIRSFDSAFFVSSSNSTSELGS